ncbi:DNA mismatch repair protein Mlh3, partial [Stegodyphus mimosarum]
MPKTLSSVLNSQACRGAVKFGDPLSLSQCENLLNSLSNCKLPFQCAHGRPSIAPILDIKKIDALCKKRLP